MKKIALCVVLLLAFQFAGCKKNSEYEDKISQLRYDVLYGETDDFDVTAYIEKREDPIFQDGLVGEKINFLTFKIEFDKDIVLKSSPVIEFETDGIKYRKETEYKPLSDFVYCFFSPKKLPDKKLNVKITTDEKSETITLISVKKKDTLTYKEALNSLIKSKTPSITEIFDGKAPYEIKIRLIYSDGYDCYFIGVETKEKSVGFLLDGSTGEIIAIK